MERSAYEEGSSGADVKSATIRNHWFRKTHNPALIRREGLLIGGSIVEVGVEWKVRAWMAVYPLGGPVSWSYSSNNVGRSGPGTGCTALSKSGKGARCCRAPEREKCVHA
jgi:hypothetical protein